MKNIKNFGVGLVAMVIMPVWLPALMIFMIGYCLVKLGESIMEKPKGRGYYSESGGIR
jgi:hypothetical protein